mgnify:CR=1 FL=1
MIYDTIKNLKNYSALNPAFEAIAKFVEENKGNFPKITTFDSIDNEEDSEDTYSFKKLVSNGSTGWLYSPSAKSTLPRSPF